MYFTYLTIKAVIALTVTVLHGLKPKGMQKYTTWYCAAWIILMSTTKDHNTALVHWWCLCLSLRSHPSCGIYLYCNMEISSNIYSRIFQVSRSFKKAPLPNNGFGTFNSTGITADPLTRKKPRIWSLGSSQHYYFLCLRLYVHQCESHPWNMTRWIYSSRVVHNLKQWALSHLGHSLEWCWLKTVQSCKWNMQYNIKSFKN